MDEFWNNDDDEVSGSDGMILDGRVESIDRSIGLHTSKNLSFWSDTYVVRCIVFHVCIIGSQTGLKKTMVITMTVVEMKKMMILVKLGQMVRVVPVVEHIMYWYSWTVIPSCSHLQRKLLLRVKVLTILIVLIILIQPLLQLHIWMNVWRRYRPWYGIK